MAEEARQFEGRPYLDREARRLAIVNAALRVAARDGWLAVTTRRVAAACEPPCVPSLVRHHFNNPKCLRDEALSVARARGLVELVAAAETDGL